MSVRLGILGLLSQRPRHGYDLHAAFTAMTGGPDNWDVKPAQIYNSLARLAEIGLAREQEPEQVGGPKRRPYEITPAGRQELRTWFSMPVTNAHQRDEFFLKLMLSLATQEVAPLKVLYTQRASLYQDLHDLTMTRQRSDPKSELAHILLLDQAIMHVEADLRWLEMVESRLDEVQEQPLPEPTPKKRGRPPINKKRRGPKPLTLPHDATLDGLSTRGREQDEN